MVKLMLASSEVRCRPEAVAEAPGKGRAGFQGGVAAHMTVPDPCLPILGLPEPLRPSRHSGQLPAPPFAIASWMWGVR